MDRPPPTRSLLSLQLLFLEAPPPASPHGIATTSAHSASSNETALSPSSLPRGRSGVPSPLASSKTPAVDMAVSQATYVSPSSMSTSFFARPSVEPNSASAQLELDIDLDSPQRLQQRRDKVRARARTPWRRAPLSAAEMRAPPAASPSPTPQRRQSTSINGRPCAPTPGGTTPSASRAERGPSQKAWNACVADYTRHETLMTDAALLLPSTYEAVVHALRSDSPSKPDTASASAPADDAPEWTSRDFVRWARSEWRFGSPEEASTEAGSTAVGKGDGGVLLVNIASGKPAVHPGRLLEVLRWAHARSLWLEEASSQTMVEKTREQFEERFASIPVSLIAQFVALYEASTQQEVEPDYLDITMLSPMSRLPSPVACFTSRPPALASRSGLPHGLDADEEEAGEDYSRTMLLNTLSPFAPASILRLPQAQGMDRRESADSQVSAASSAQPPTPRDERDSTWPCASPDVLDKPSNELSFSLPSVFQQIAPSGGEDSFFGAPAWNSSDAVFDPPTTGLDPRRWWWEQDGGSLGSLCDTSDDSTGPSCDSGAHEETLYTAVSEPALHRRSEEAAAERPTASAFVSSSSAQPEAPIFSNRMPPPPSLSFAPQPSPRRRTRLSSEVPSSAPSWQTEFGQVAAASCDVPASTLHALLAQDEQRQVREATLTRRMQRAARLAAAASEELGSVVPTLESSLPTTTAVSYGPQFGAVFGAVTGGSGNLFDGTRSQIDAASVARRTAYGSPDLAVYLAPSYGIPSSDSKGRILSSASATLPRRASAQSAAADQSTSFGSPPMLQGLGLEMPPPTLRSTAELRRHTVTGERTSPPANRAAFDAPPLPQPPCYSLADAPKTRVRPRGASVLHAKQSDASSQQQPQQQSQRMKWGGVDPFEHLSGAQRLVLSQVATLMAQQNLDAENTSLGDSSAEMVIPIVSTIPVATTVDVKETAQAAPVPSAESDVLRLAQLEAEIEAIKARQARLQPLPIAGHAHHARERARHEADQTLSSAASSDLELSRDSIGHVSGSSAGRRHRRTGSVRRSALSRSASMRASPDIQASWSCSMTQSASLDTLASASSVLVDGVPLGKTDPRSPARRRIGSTSLCEVAEYACSDESAGNELLLLPSMRFVELAMEESLPVCSTPAAAAEQPGGAKLGRRHTTATAAARRERSSISLAAHHEPLALLCAQRSLRCLPATSLSSATTSVAQAVAMSARKRRAEATTTLPALSASVATLETPGAADCWADFSGEYTTSDESFTASGAGALVTRVPSGVSSAAMAHAAAILEAAVVDARTKTPSSPAKASTPASSKKLVQMQAQQPQSFFAKAIGLLNAAGTPSSASRVQA